MQVKNTFFAVLFHYLHPLISCAMDILVQNWMYIKVVTTHISSALALNVGIVVKITQL